MTDEELNTVTADSKFFAIPYNGYSCYVVHVPTGRDQADNQIQITQKVYEKVLLANQSTAADIRVIEDLKGNLSVGAFNTFNPNEYHVWNPRSQKFEVPAEKQVEYLAYIKEQQKEEINNARTTAELSGFWFNEKGFDSDRDSISRISNAAISAQSALLMQKEFIVDWTTMDNSIMTLDARGVLSMQGAMVANVDAINNKARLLKIRIDEAKTVEEVQRVQWE